MREFIVVSSRRKQHVRFLRESVTFQRWCSVCKDWVCAGIRRRSRKRIRAVLKRLGPRPAVVQIGCTTFRNPKLLAYAREWAFHEKAK